MGLRKPNRSSESSNYLFNSYYEERKTYEYLKNLINSIYFNKTNEMFNFAVTALGKRIFLEIIQRGYSESKEEDFEKWEPSSRNNCPLSNNIMATLLQKDIIPVLDKRIRVLSGHKLSDVEKRLIVMQNTFRLTDAEREVVAFYYLKHTCGVIREHLDNDSRIDDFSLLLKLRRHGDTMLGLARPEFLKVFTNEMVFKAQLFESNKHSKNLEIASWTIDYLSGLGNSKLETEFFDKENDESLEVGDFTISTDEMSVIDALIKSKTGKNLLFYGLGGVGKTSFARCLAKKYGLELLSVKVPESDDIEDRIRALYATANFADKKKSIILVDESDEILNSSSSPTFKNVMSKSWINNFLDANQTITGKKIIWITNRSSEIDPSTMRRFSFTLEFKKFDPVKRLKVLKYALNKNHIPAGYFSDEELSNLCRNYSVNASGIIHAIEAADISKRTNKDIALRKMTCVLKNHEKAIGAAGTVDKVKTFENYSLKSLNTSEDLNSIVSALQKVNQMHSSNDTSLTILLHGEPGTGKTEFVSYLGHVLGKEVLLKRASDIESSYVGETEKNIASAFQEAREKGFILFFDEGDSFLFPRNQAMRSYEKRHTNEILTQIENHQGLVIFATNDINGLDHAALRRFGFKIRFNPLKPDGNVQIYEKLLMPLVHDDKMTHDEIERLRNIQQLTHGDFNVIRKQLYLLGNDGITHEKLISSLENEVKYKKSDKVIGF